MNGQTLVDGVREGERTELDRLGSDKAMIAATNADLDTGPVLTHVALTLDGLQAVCEAWAETSADEDASALYAATAEAASEEYARVTDAMEEEPSGETPAGAVTLETFEADPARIGGLVGQSLSFDRTLLQAVNFFVNEGDETMAATCRDARNAAGEDATEGGNLVATLCTDPDDWERAETVAVETIAVAYDDYEARLEAMGLDPRPVC